MESFLKVGQERRGFEACIGASSYDGIGMSVQQNVSTYEAFYFVGGEVLFLCFLCLLVACVLADNKQRYHCFSLNTGETLKKENILKIDFFFFRLGRGSLVILEAQGRATQSSILPGPLFHHLT